MKKLLILAAVFFGLVSFGHCWPEEPFSRPAGSLNGGNAWGGTQTFSGNVGIATNTTTEALNVGGNLYLNAPIGANRIYANRFTSSLKVEMIGMDDDDSVFLGGHASVNSVNIRPGSTSADQLVISKLGYTENQGLEVYLSSSVTIADDGAGTSPAYTLTPNRSSYRITCNDTNGCTITLGETSIRDGTQLKIVNMGANTVTFADTSGVSETAGAFAAGQYDAIAYVYATDRWVEISRSNN